MSLSQTQIIQSLGEALSWFEKELEWGAPPQELRHLTGRIGELYVAMITNGSMASDVNQPGYDVISSSNERISVKTITTTKNIRFNPNTFERADRVIIVQLNVDDDTGVSIEILEDQPADVFKASMSGAGDAIRYSRTRKQAPVRDDDDLDVRDHGTFDSILVEQLENQTIRASRSGVPLTPVKPYLRELAKSLNVSILNGSGNKKNTRQLGADILKAITAQSET
jgi:hypothetical protein